MKEENHIFFYQPNDSYGWLSNFYLSPFAKHVTFQDNSTELVIFPSNENFFQSHKAIFDKDLFYRINNASPKNARIWGRTEVKLPEKWREELSFKIMLEGLFLKFTQNKKLAKLLIKTGESIIHENSPIDFKWGCQNSGQDLLGKFLSHIRRNLISNNNFTDSFSNNKTHVKTS